MKKRGFFLVLEATSKCGKTTLSKLLQKRLIEKGQRKVILKRGALSTSKFGTVINNLRIQDIGYSSAFYWADLLFDTMDCIKKALSCGSIIIQDRYDLSIVTYREINNFYLDSFLLDEYLKRNLLLHPDLTVFLNPPAEVIIKRIKESEENSSIDLQFLDYPEKINLMQERIEYHLKRLNRNYINLNTSAINRDECLELIMKKLPGEILYEK